MDLLALIPSLGPTGAAVLIVFLFLKAQKENSNRGNESTKRFMEELAAERAHREAAMEICRNCHNTTDSMVKVIEQNTRATRELTTAIISRHDTHETATAAAERITEAAAAAANVVATAAANAANLVSTAAEKAANPPAAHTHPFGFPKHG